MSYWKTPSSLSTAALDKFVVGGQSSNTQNEFYEMEPAIVLDIILDKTHKFFSGHTLDPDRSPPSILGTAPLKSDPDYTWMGRSLVRLIYSQKRVEKEKLIWALPLESNISEFPLLNEIVGVVNYLGTYYYTRKINLSNYVNANPSFNAELSVGGFRQNPRSPIEGNRELQTNPSDNTFVPYKGPLSKLTIGSNQNWSGALGRYFLFNNRIRNLRRREGDMVFESRFGQSIRFGAYDDNRYNDVGDYTDYKGDGVKNPFSGTVAGGGNPMILIRNRQRSILPAGKETYPYSNANVPPIRGTEDEKNVGGQIVEDVNNDGSSIHLTSGATITGFVTTCYKKMFGNGEEQPAYQPLGATPFTYPKPANGDQIVINSDRIIISSKTKEMFHFSKKRMSFVTDDEYTVDAHDQIVFTTNTKTVLNSPAIYLGEYNQTGEPVLLGQTSVNWLYELCEWLKVHTHWFYHQHPDADTREGATGQPYSPKTQIPVEVERLKILQANLQTLLSRRVFVTGGGFAPGQDGGNLGS